MSKKLLLLLTFFSTLTLNAQPFYFYNDRYMSDNFIYEAGVSGGLMNSLTDLGGKKGIGKKFIKDLDWKNTKPCFGLFFITTWQDKIGIRLEGTFGKIVSYDSVLKPVAPSTFGRYERNLSFRSKVSDVQLSLEFHPLYIFGNFVDKDPPRLSPYVIGGIGFFSFDPQAQLNGNWYRLQPLHTEGQGFTEFRERKPYKLTQINIPVGLGARYELSSYLNMRIELVHRILSTDYLDDVSTSYINPSLFANYMPAQQAQVATLLADRQYETIPGHITTPGEIRGDPKDKDAYFSIVFKLSYVFGRTNR